MAPLLQTVPILVAAFGGGGTMLAAAPSPQEAPASGSPVFSLSGDHRTRYERLSNQFRAGLDGVARALMLRTGSLRGWMRDTSGCGPSCRTRGHIWRTP